MSDTLQQISVFNEGVELSRKEYELLRKLVYEQSGINLGDEKMQLVKARLGKRIRKGNFKSFRQYYDFVIQDKSGQEMCTLLDSISTNTTHLFREPHHFEYLKKNVTELVNDKTWCSRYQSLTIWSSACSSGEEPYSIAMVVHDALQNHPSINVKILATDISTLMLKRAQRGIFDHHRVGTVPHAYKNRCLKKIFVDGQPMFQVVPEVRKLIKFARFNLMSPTFPFKQGFDIIFSRNVMIYFDKPTQETLVNKYAQHLRSGGRLLIGHSESLNGLQHPLKYMEPTIYKKK